MEILEEQNISSFKRFVIRSMKGTTLSSSVTNRVGKNFYQTWRRISCTREGLFSSSVMLSVVSTCTHEVSVAQGTRSEGIMCKGTASMVFCFFSEDQSSFMISDQIHLSHSAFSIRFELLLLDDSHTGWRKVGRQFVTTKPQENASMLILVYVLDAVCYLPTLSPRNNCMGLVSPSTSA